MTNRGRTGHAPLRTARQQRQSTHLSEQADRQQHPLERLPGTFPGAGCSVCRRSSPCSHTTCSQKHEGHNLARFRHFAEETHGSISPQPDSKEKLSHSERKRRRRSKNQATVANPAPWQHYAALSHVQGIDSSACKTLHPTQRTQIDMVNRSDLPPLFQPNPSTSRLPDAETYRQDTLAHKEDTHQ